jgi:hypothetical protein
MKLNTHTKSQNFVVFFAEINFAYLKMLLYQNFNPEASSFLVI